ncbi:MAG: hypothetical protein RMJ56_14775 [Gemmataceae bacterium]|nr:hypothetical protein [Gemmata sp.]MDW8198859.1 hypothetical protein [Gemmataceae bacterium]
MTAGRRHRLVAVFALAALLVPLATSRGTDPVRQRDEQKKIKARVDEAARRAASTLDAMMFQRLTPNAEQKVLQDVAAGLRGLSETEIQAVLDHLEKAVMAPDPQTATAEQKAAYAKHLQIVQQLKVMLGQLDVIKSLEEAAERLERAAEKEIQLDAHAHTNSLRSRGIDDRDELATEQADLRNEVVNIFKGIQRLVEDKLLTPDQQARVEKADALTRGQRLTAEMATTITTIRQGRFLDASERLRRHAKELKDLAAALRTPPGSRLEALKAAQAEVVKAIDAQRKANQDAAERNEADFKAPPGIDPKAARANDLANQQAKAEFATRDARRATERVAPEIAEKLKPAETQQWKAEDALRAKNIAAAREPQERALEALQQAKDELDRQIAAAELAKNDPLAATKQAIEQLDRIIKDQKDTNARTEKALERPDRLPDAANAQKDVARKTDELRNTPLPPNTQAQQALQKALEAQKQAAEKLDNKQPRDAQPDQQAALDELQRARDELEKQAQAIEQRREQLAQLEDLKGRLEELAKNEQNIAKAADQAAADPRKPDTTELGQKQADLVNPTKEVGQQLEKLAPEAAQKVGDAAKKQEAAKNDLAMNMPMAGAEKAKDAAAQLNEAAKDLQKQIDQMKGQEAADQAALQPNKVDPQQAAQQLQKALEQAQQAAQQAKMADMALNPMPADGMPPMGTPDLAQLQKDIAQKAAEQQLPDAAKAAEKAAEALKKGDLPQAIENQQKALEELKRATMPPGMMGEKGMNPGMGMQQPMGGMMGEKGMPPGMMGQQGMPTMGGMMGEKGMTPGMGMQQPMGGMMGEKGMNPGMGMQQPMGGMMGTPNDLAKQQQQVLDATKALQQSQQANNAAQAALQQAQANAPMAVQNQLQQAGNQLQQAGNQLQQGQPGQAGMNQQQAAQNLQQALDALNQAAMAQGQQAGMMGMGMMGMGQMGQGMGQMGQGQGMGSNAQQGMNMGMGEGDMAGGEKLKNVGSMGNDVTGDGSFIKMRSKERDKVQQATDSQFPAEFRELIKQYNINIKNGKPAPTPPVPGK